MLLIRKCAAIVYYFPNFNNGIFEVSPRARARGKTAVVGRALHL
jgi:hypothetical protein